MRRKTTEEFIKEAQEVHGNLYDYSKTSYENTRTKVLITCSIHGDFYQLPNNHIMKKYGCPKCGSIKQGNTKRHSLDQFIAKAKQIHGDKYYYNLVDYASNAKKVKIVCPIHGVFLQTPHNHLAGQGCKKCAYEKLSKDRTILISDFIDRATIIHNNKYDYSLIKEIGKNKKVPIICREHGIFYLTTNSHLSGCGCKKCADVQKGYNCRLSLQVAIERLQNNNSNYDYSHFQYITENTKSRVICKLHGEFLCSYTNLMLGKGCPKCSLKSQTKLYEYLVKTFPEEEILFEVNNTVIPWIRTLRIDIYFPKYNIAVEYDGEQHYRPIDFFGGEKEFKKIRFLDAFKSTLCKENDCELFRVKYNYSQQDLNTLVHNIKFKIFHYG